MTYSQNDDENDDWIQDVELYRVQAFCTESGGGNAAGVVLLAGELDGLTMQRIASRAGFSETAFLLSSEVADHRLRFFTPRKEVDVCGHATVAAYHLMRDKMSLDTGVYEMETRSGVLEVECRSDGMIVMAQNAAEFGPVVDCSDVLEALGLVSEQIAHSASLPIQLASTGLWKIFVPVRTVDDLRSIRPSQGMIERVSQFYGAIGMYVYTLDTALGVTAHCRNFAPVVGIAEDAATGTSAAALSCLLHRYGVVASEEREWLTYEQGESLGQPSLIYCKIWERDAETLAVSVAGYALTVELLH